MYAQVMLDRINRFHRDRTHHQENNPQLFLAIELPAMMLLLGHLHRSVHVCKQCFPVSFIVETNHQLPQSLFFSSAWLNLQLFGALGVHLLEHHLLEH